MSPELPLDAVIEHLSSLAMRPTLDLVRVCADRHGVDATVVGLLGAAQQEVGRRWEFGEWTVAQEHAATAIVDAAVAQLHLRVDEHTPPTGPHLALVCAEGEWHVTPARMAAVRFLDRGWHVTFLGASTPGPHLARTLGVLRPDVVGVSCTLPANLPGIRNVADVAHGLGLPVLAGGRALGVDDRRARALGADAGGADLDVLEDIARSWLDGWVAREDPVPVAWASADRLATTREMVVAAALDDLARLPNASWAHDPRARERVRDDLRWILRFVEVSLDVGDPSVLHEFLGWLQGLLAVHAVPVQALAAGIDRLAAHLDPELEAPRAALLAGRRWLDAGVGAGGS